MSLSGPSLVPVAVVCLSHAAEKVNSDEAGTSTRDAWFSRSLHVSRVVSDRAQKQCVSPQQTNPIPTTLTTTATSVVPLPVKYPAVANPAISKHRPTTVLPPSAIPRFDTFHCVIIILCDSCSSALSPIERRFLGLTSGLEFRTLVKSYYLDTFLLKQPLGRYAYPT